MSRRFPLIDGQRGMSTSTQLLASGWTRGAIRHLASRAGQIVMPGVYCAHSGSLNEEDRLVAAHLWAGDGALLTGAPALARHGLALPRPPLATRFVVPDTRNNRTHGSVETLHAHVLPAHRILGGIPVVCLERALLDAARGFDCRRDEIRALTIAALQGRLTSPPRLGAALSATNRNGTAGIRHGLADFRAGAWSVPEGELARLVTRHRPHLRFVLNPRLMAPDGLLIGIPDMYLPDHALAVQVHSREFHHGRAADGRDQWALTVEWDSLYLAHRIAPLGVAPATIRDHPQRFLAQLDAVIRAQEDRTRPALRVVTPAPAKAS